MRLYANFSHSVFDEGNGTFGVYFGHDDVLVEDGFTSLESAIQYADLHETGGRTEPRVGSSTEGSYER